MRSQSMNDVSTKSDSGQLNDYQKSLGGHMEGKWKNGGSVSYELNIGGLLGPRKMTACLPVQSYRGDENRQSFVKLKSKTPTWHEGKYARSLITSYAELYSVVINASLVGLEISITISMYSDVALAMRSTWFRASWLLSRKHPSIHSFV